MIMELCLQEVHFLFSSRWQQVDNYKDFFNGYIYAYIPETTEIFWVKVSFKG